MRAIPAGMDHALRNALVIEVEDLLAEVRVLDQRWAARALLEGVLVVGDRNALLRGEDVVSVLGDLMGLSTHAPVDGLVAIVDRIHAVGLRTFRHCRLPLCDNNRAREKTFLGD